MSDQPKPTTGRREWTVRIKQILTENRLNYDERIQLLSDEINAALDAERRARLFAEHDLIAKFDEQLAAAHERFNTQEKQWLGENLKLTDALAAERSRNKELQDEIERLKR